MYTNTNVNYILVNDVKTGFVPILNSNVDNYLKRFEKLAAFV